MSGCAPVGIGLASVRHWSNGRRLQKKLTPLWNYTQRGALHPVAGGAFTRCDRAKALIRLLFFGPSVADCNAYFLFYLLMSRRAFALRAIDVDTRAESPIERRAWQATRM
jgi:hypothetical protein